MVKRILGLDLGTNSIGWGVVEDLGGGRLEPIKSGVHVFPEGVNVEKGNEYSKAAARTAYRAARRLKFRRKLRKLRTLKELSAAGLCPPLDVEELKAWQTHKIYPANAAFRAWCKTIDPGEGESGEAQNPYYYRWLAATDVLNMADEADRYKLGRAFYHLAQRRGFKSNRFDAWGKEAISVLREKIMVLLDGTYESKSELTAAVLTMCATQEEDARARAFQQTVQRGVKSASGLKEALQFLSALLSKRENLGKVKGDIADLSEKMKGRTLGQYFYEECYGKKRIRTVQTSRDEHYVAEFYTICDKQHLSDRLRNRLFKAIFYQRPLKSQKGLVASCPFEPKKKRASISHPLFEEFRMWQTLNQIKIKTLADRELRPLKLAEKEVIMPLFFRVSKTYFEFKDIAKLLTPKGQKIGYFKGDETGTHVLFNYRENQTLSGCPMLSAFKMLFGDDYRQGIRETYRGNAQDTNGQLKTDDDLLHEVWHVLYSFNKLDKVKKYARNRLWMDEAEADRYAKISPKRGYAELSLKAIRKIMPHLKEGWKYSHALFFAYSDDAAERSNGNDLDERVSTYLKDRFGLSRKDVANLYHPSALEGYAPASIGEDGLRYLSDPRITWIRNPVFMRTMYRMKAVVNELLKQGIITEQSAVHVEMENELNNANRRAALKSWRHSREQERKKYKAVIDAALQDMGLEREASDEEIMKYQLWEEQRHICPYTGGRIDLFAFIGDNSRYEVKHTIPLSQCCDNSMENKTLCDWAFNRNVKKNRIPATCPHHAEIMQRIDHWRVRVDKLSMQMELKKNAAKRASTKEQKDKAIQQRLVLAIRRDYFREKYRRFAMKEITPGFKNSQLSDSRVIAKYVRLYLQTVFPSVHLINQRTARDIRISWRVDRACGNYAQHAVRAVVAACITRARYERLAHYYHEVERYEQFDSSTHARPYFPQPWTTFMRDVQEMRETLLISHFVPDILTKQSKKKLRTRQGLKYLHKDGQLLLDAAGNPIPIYQKGDTVRGSLHKETFYGAIREHGGSFETAEGAYRYVVRKPLLLLADADVKNIVDERIRNIVERGRAEEKRIQKALERLKRDIATAVEKDSRRLQQEMDELQYQLVHLYELPNRSGKAIPINKVRVFTRLKDPVALKPHRDVSAQPCRSHKQFYYVTNDGNYLMALYEGTDENGSMVRDAKIVRNLEAGQFFKTSNKQREGGVVPNMKDGLPLKQILKSGMEVLLYKEHPDELRELSASELAGRLYIIRGLDEDGIKLYFHQEARNTTEVLRHMNDILNRYNLRNRVLDKNGACKTSRLTTPKGGNVVGLSHDFPYIKFKPTNFNALIEGVDFKLNILGEIQLQV